MNKNNIDTRLPLFECGQTILGPEIPKEGMHRDLLRFLASRETRGFRFVKIGLIKTSKKERPILDVMVVVFHTHGHISTYEIWQMEDYVTYPIGVRYVRDYEYMTALNYLEKLGVSLPRDTVYKLSDFITKLGNMNAISLLRKLPRI